MDWAKNRKIWKKNYQIYRSFDEREEKKIWKFSKNLAMFFKLFFPEIAPDWSRTFQARKKNSHMTNVGRGIFFQAGIWRGVHRGSARAIEIFFFLGRPKFFWSWHISGSFGQNFRVLMEETFARTGLIKKRKKKK